MDPKELELDARAAGFGIGFVGTHEPEAGFGPFEVSVGNRVTLKRGAVTVIVDVCEIREQREYVGKVVGFENWGKGEFQGVRPGDLVRFRHDRIRGCIL